MVAQTISRLALLATVVWAVRALMRTRRDRHGVPARKPQAIEAWEGEGGAVPVSSGRTAAAVTPLPPLPEARSGL